MSEYEMKYPTPTGNTSDRSLAFNKENPDMFKVLTYWGYSSKSGEYSAIESTWRFVEHEDRIRLHLESISLKYPHIAWFKVIVEPDRMISDAHLRMAREQYRTRSQKERCDFLILTPSKIYYEEKNLEEKR